MSTKRSINENSIAREAARILQETFINTSLNERVLYVEDDVLISKSPNSSPVVIKQLSSRNPEFSQKIKNRKIFKIKKKS